MDEWIVIRGASENNLKKLDVDIPRNKMTVITGLSGSGKSSLAFDTIYAEGQRRYVESLSSYARQFLGQMDKPAVEYIGGLSPSISIDQKTTSKNPRSTVGTVTEIYDYLRLLYARIGHVHCPKCGKRIESQSIDRMVDRVLALPEGTRLSVLAPVVRGKKGEHVKLFEQLEREGFVRAYIDGVLYTFDALPKLEKNQKHTIEVVVDRLKRKDGMHKRLVDSMELALKMADGLVVIRTDDEDLLFNENFSCPDCDIAIEELSTRLFSFNSPFGACPTCNGLGFFRNVSRASVMPNPELSIREGALIPYGHTDTANYYMKMFQTIADRHSFSLDRPMTEAPEAFLSELFDGTSDRLAFTYHSSFGGRSTSKRYTGPWEGVLENLRVRYEQTTSDYVRGKIDECMEESACPDCHGRRLNANALSVRVGGRNIAELTELDIDKEIRFFETLELSEMEAVIAEEILKEILSRLRFLQAVGLSYLTLSRMALSLSGGESQRIRLATQIGSKLVGVIYVLDEPSIGLHQRDNARLIATLCELRDAGNTVLVVEHDEDTMRAADYILDIGPGAGIHGGEVVAFGTPEDVAQNTDSITGAYLSGRRKIPVPDARRPQNKGILRIRNAREHNLKGIDVEIPLGVFTCVTGVSGSGKSSLVEEILYKNLARTLNRSKVKPGASDGIDGMEQLDKVVVIDQSPIGRTPRSNPATYTGVFDLIRDVFAMTPEAKQRGYQKGRFSFNVRGGRCEACKGDGIIKVEMNFLPDVYVPCEVCKGKRYNRETLEVRYKDKNIADVLDMSVEEALDFFQHHPAIRRKLQTLQDVGLGYIKLGQSSTQLSGGEAQRIKLAAELSKRATGRTMYILDEPTTGLHAEDVAKLIGVLQRLTDTGNSMVIIEHNLDVIKVSDYIVDLGPEGGDLGGNLVACGTPEEVAACPESFTGAFLRPLLEDEGKQIPGHPSAKGSRRKKGKTPSEKISSSD